MSLEVGDVLGWGEDGDVDPVADFAREGEEGDCECDWGCHCWMLA